MLVLWQVTSLTTHRSPSAVQSPHSPHALLCSQSSSLVARHRPATAVHWPSEEQMSDSLQSESRAAVHSSAPEDEHLPASLHGCPVLQYASGIAIAPPMSNRRQARQALRMITRLFGLGDRGSDDASAAPGSIRTSVSATRPGRPVERLRERPLLGDGMSAQREAALLELLRNGRATNAPTKKRGMAGPRRSREQTSPSVLPGGADAAPPPPKMEFQRWPPTQPAPRVKSRPLPLRSSSRGQSSLPDHFQVGAVSFAKASNVRIGCPTMRSQPSSSAAVASRPSAWK
jgi:hypothetical protein